MGKISSGEEAGCSSQYGFRRQNQQDQVMAGRGMWEESGMILGLLTLISLKFFIIPDLGSLIIVANCRLFS